MPMYLRSQQVFSFEQPFILATVKQEYRVTNKMENQVARTFWFGMRPEKRDEKSPRNREHDNACPLESLRFASISGAFGKNIIADRTRSSKD